MGQETERKFLVDHERWQQVVKPAGDFYRQGYLLTDPAKTIRVRVTDTSGFLTIKGLTVKASRPEYEYQIPRPEAIELLDQFSVSELSKIRYKINHKDKIWEVDEFLGANAGLIVAELELEHADDWIDLPEWVGKEVTGEDKYYNSVLTLHPYKEWTL